MRKIWYMLLLLLVVSSSCKDEWDNFYGEGEDDDRAASSKVTLWEVIEQEPNYSKFKLLLEKTGFAEELHKGRILTVWLPLDGYITEDIMALDSFDMRRFVLNHMNSLALYRTKLETKNEIETLADKYVRIDGRGDNISVEDIKVSRFDRACVNGVIHEINGLLIPEKNVMEYLLESGEEYSLYRDSLLAYNDTVFNLEESYPIGINEVGQTVYDSVFEITNELMRYVDFADEEETATLFLPSNEVIGNMIMDLKLYNESLGLEMTNADTLLCFDFLLRATFLGFELENMSGVRSIYTAGGKRLRFDKQHISTAYERCSNGLVYEFQKAYVPRDQFMKTVEYIVPTLFELPEEEWSNYYQMSNGEVLNDNVGGGVENNIFRDGNNPSWEFLAVKAEKDVYIDLVLLQKDVYGEIKPAKLMPGKYSMTGKGYGYRSANVTISLNNQPLTYKKHFSTIGNLVFPMGGTANFGYEGDKYKEMCDTIYVGINQGNDVIRIKSEGSGSMANSIKIRALKLVPVGENY